MSDDPCSLEGSTHWKLSLFATLLLLWSEWVWRVLWGSTYSKRGVTSDGRGCAELVWRLWTTLEEPEKYSLGLLPSCAKAMSFLSRAV